MSMTTRKALAVGLVFGLMISVGYGFQRIMDSVSIDGYLALGGISASGLGAGDLSIGDDLVVGGEISTTGDVTFSEDVSLAVSADDELTFGAGYASKFRVGAGSTPDITLGDDDVFIEGTLEVDGEAQFDGIVDANSTMDVADTATFSKGSGNALVVSAGGAIDANGAADIADTLTLSKGAGNALVIDAGGELDANGTADFAGDVVLNEDVSFGVGSDDVITLTDGYYNKIRIGTGSSPDVAFAADGLFVEGAAELDSTLRLDGAADFNSTADIGGALTLSAGAGNALVVSAGGAISALGGAAISGAAITLNDDSNFTTGIGTGTSTGAVSIGGGSNTCAISTTSWGVSTAGDATGLTGLDVSGQVDFTDAINLGDGADTVTLHASAVPVNFPYTMSFYQDPELGDGTKEGAMVGELAATASTGTEADLTYSYVDNDAGTASIAGTEDAADCNSATADDCATFADAGAEAIGDGLYYCAATQFHGLGFTIAGTAMVNSGATGQWEYPTADDTWAAFDAELSDGTNGAQDSLEQTGRILWTMPEDWFENATGGTKAMAADSGFCVRYVLTAANVTTVAVMDQVTVIVPAATDEDLPQVPIAGTLTGISSNCDTAPSGVATHLTIWNATSGLVAYHTIADGNYSDRTGGLSLAFSAGDELAIVSDCDSTGASCAEGCGVVLELQ